MGVIYWYLGVYRGMEKTKDTIIIFGSGFVVVQLPVCRLSWSPIECNLVDRTVPIFFCHCLIQSQLQLLQ